MHAHYLHPFIPSVCHTVGFPGVSDGKESACNAEDLGSIPGLEDPLEESMVACSSILAWRSLAGYSPLGHKDLDMTEAT